MAAAILVRPDISALSAAAAAERLVSRRESVMGEQYRQLLISHDKNFAPSAAKVREFLSEVTELGVVPGQPAIVLRVRSGRTREYPNPFTGETIVVELKDSRSFQTLEEFENAADRLTDFEVQISGEGRPRLPPLEVDFDDPYYVGVTCFVSSVLRSTSAESYQQACNSLSTTGVFRHPEIVETIEVP